MREEDLACIFELHSNPSCGHGRHYHPSAHPLHSDDSLLLIINSVGTNTLPQNNGHLVSLQYPFISDKELRPMRRSNIPTTGLWQPDP